MGAEGRFGGSETQAGTISSMLLLASQGPWSVL